MWVIIMTDYDDSYALTDSERFITRLRNRLDQNLALHRRNLPVAAPLGPAARVCYKSGRGDAA